MLFGEFDYPLELEFLGSIWIEPVIDFPEKIVG
jgi:hypothetical protein